MRPRLHRLRSAPARRGACGALALALLLAACGQGSGTLSKHEIQVRLRAIAASSDGGSAYYLGDAFADLPLTYLQTEGDDWFFVYGTCHVPPGEEGGCSPPVQLQLTSFAVPWEQIVGCSRLASLRGVPTVRLDGLVLFTGRPLRAIKVYARSDAEELLAVAALRPVRPGIVPAALPPPSPADTAGISRACGAKPGQSGPSEGVMGPGSAG